MPHLILVADIGGTSSRLALVGPDSHPQDVRIHRNDAFSGFEALIEADLATRGDAADDVGGAVLAIAGPADGEEVRLTNRDWSFAKQEMRKRFGWQTLRGVNDFEALAYGVPALQPADLVAIGGGEAVAGAPMMVCGPGTGFGVAGLQQIGGEFHAITGEGGHCRLGATNTEEARLIAHMVRELGPVAVEHALSGSGLARIHRILTGDRLSPEEVIALANEGDIEAVETCQLFLRLFGRIAGDFALTFDARGGVFLAGGVSIGLLPFFEASPFREAFEEHPPFDPRLAATPVSVITHPTPGLLGCAQLGGRLARDLTN